MCVLIAFTVKKAYKRPPQKNDGNLNTNLNYRILTRDQVEKYILEKIENK